MFEINVRMLKIRKNIEKQKLKVCEKWKEGIEWLRNQFARWQKVI